MAYRMLLSVIHGSISFTALGQVDKTWRGMLKISIVPIEKEISSHQQFNPYYFYYKLFFPKQPLSS